MSAAGLAEGPAPARGVAPALLAAAFPAEHLPPTDPPHAWAGTADLWRTARRNLLTHHPAVDADCDVRCAAPTCDSHFPCALALAAVALLGVPERSTLYAIASHLRQSAATAAVVRQRTAGTWPPP
jgi:hypothetical protein